MAASRGIGQCVRESVSSQLLPCLSCHYTSLFTMCCMICNTKNKIKITYFMLVSAAAGEDLVRRGQCLHADIISVHCFAALQHLLCG